MECLWSEDVELHGGTLMAITHDLRRYYQNIPGRAVVRLEWTAGRWCIDCGDRHTTRATPLPWPKDSKLSPVRGLCRRQLRENNEGACRKLDGDVEEEALYFECGGGRRGAFTRMPAVDARVKPSWGRAPQYCHANGTALLASI